MQLIGMLDSPYVRRVAISLQLLGLRFEHRCVSVFRQFAEFQTINPVVKAPSLVCDDGQVLMDSSLILDYAETLAFPRSLLPTVLPLRQQALRTTGLALAACEKSVQLVYEQQLRPSDKQHAPWVGRITGQLLAACDALEREVAQHPLPHPAIDQAGVSTAVAWTFIQAMLPQVVDAKRYPALVAWTMHAEQQPEFRAAPHSDLTYVQAS
ncbi:MAG: glutathione S-transferase [Rhizobacter sp.]